MVLDIFDYFWNTYHDFFKKNECIDDKTGIWLTEDNIFHFETVSWNTVSESMIEKFDNIIKELLGNINKTNLKISEKGMKVEIEYIITEEMKKSICMLSKINGYEVFECEL